MHTFFFIIHEYGTSRKNNEVEIIYNKWVDLYDITVNKTVDMSK